MCFQLSTNRFDVGWPISRHSHGCSHRCSLTLPRLQEIVRYKAVRCCTGTIRLEIDAMKYQPTRGSPEEQEPKVGRWLTTMGRSLYELLNKTLNYEVDDITVAAPYGLIQTDTKVSSSLRVSWTTFPIVSSKSILKN